MQYSLYTVSVTKDSNIVTGGTGTKFLANVKAGNAFKVKSDPIIYQVASVASDTQLVLSTAYQGSTAYNVQYQVTTDYTPNFGFAEINIGDQDWPVHLTVETIRKIDSILGGISTGLTFIGSWDASTNTPSLPTASPNNLGWIYKVSVSGTTNIDGTSIWVVGDSLISNGSIWVRVPAPEQDVAELAEAAATSASEAAAAALIATTKAAEASDSATSAATSAGSASSSATSASNSAASLAAALQAFQQTFLGRFAVDPTVDTQGNPLLDGATYINTVSDKIRVYSAETSTWKDYDEAAQAATTSANLAATNAATSAIQAAASLSDAETAADAASDSASAAAASATSALDSASLASGSATTATTKAAEAADSADSALLSETNAADSADTASTAATTASGYLISFNGLYLGVKTTDPLLDNNGNPLVAGTLYFYQDIDQLNSIMKVYNGANWTASYASLAGAMVGSNNLSDVSSIELARQNIGAASITDVMAIAIALG